MKSLLIILVLISSRAFAALGATTVWEVRSGGNNNNGGGYVPGSSGTDFTQQDAAQFALTGVTTAGADAVLLDANAAASMVGNVARIVSGTNFTVGYYEILSVVVGVSITLDRTCATAAGALGVVNIGGAVATIGQLGSATAGLGAVAGNLICIKATGTYSLTTATEAFAAPGTSTAPIRICGYTTTRPTVSTHGDAWQGRTNTNGPIITTNYPTYTYTTGFLTVSGNYVILESIKFTGARNGILVFLDCHWSRMVRCATTNTPTTGTAGESVRNGGICSVIDSDFSNINGGGAGLCALRFTDEGVGIGCRIVSGAAGIIMNSDVMLVGNTIYGCVGIGLDIQTTSARVTVNGNTIVGGSSDGIRVSSTYTSSMTISNNCITDNAGYGMNFQTTASTVLLIANRTRDNTSGAINLGTNWVNATNYSPVTTDTGGPETDYVSAGTPNFDYRLIAASPATSAAQPASASMGALQRDQTGSGGGQKSYSF